MKIVAFTVSPPRRRDPQIDAGDLVLFDAHIIGKRASSPQVATISKPPPPMMEIVTNAYRPPEVLRAGPSFLVSEYVAGVLTKHQCNVKFYPVQIGKSYFIPNEPGALITRSIFPSTGLFDMIPEALSRFQVPPSSKKYYEVAMFQCADAEPEDLVTKKITIKAGMVTPRSYTIGISESLINKNKIYASEMYICDAELFEDLVPFLPYGFYWHAEIVL